MVSKGKLKLKPQPESPWCKQVRARACSLSLLAPCQMLCLWPSPCKTSQNVTVDTSIKRVHGAGVAGHGALRPYLRDSRSPYLNLCRTMGAGKTR